MRWQCGCANVQSQTGLLPSATIAWESLFRALACVVIACVVTGLDLARADASGVCGTPDNDPDAALRRARVASSRLLLPRADLRRSASVMVTFHIVEPWSEGGSIDASDLQSALTRLNLAFGDAGIQFGLGTVDTITDPDSFWGIEGESEIAALLNTNAASGTINVYVVGEFTMGWEKAGDDVTGYGTPTTTKGFQGVLVEEEAFEMSVLVHEMGHFFDLEHTHTLISDEPEGCSDGECPDGACCDVLGDRRCDTPMDPGLLGVVDGACGYTGTAKACGLPYQPDTTNFMSYAPSHCSYRFSPSQLVDVAATLAIARSDLIAYSPFIGFAPAALGFVAVVGGADPTPRPLEVWNSAGLGNLTWTAEASSSWLSVSPTTGSSTGEKDTLSVTADVTGLSPGIHQAVVTIASPGASNSPQVIPVHLDVVAGGTGPRLCISPPELDFGLVVENYEVRKEFGVSHCGTSGSVSGSATIGGWFNVVDGSPFNLSPGQVTSVGIRFRPGGTDLYLAGAVFTTSAGNTSRQVKGRGIPNPGTRYTCDSPRVIKCGETVQGDLHDGANSYETYCDEGGQCERRYEGPEQVHKIHLDYVTDLSFPYCIYNCNGTTSQSLLFVTRECASGAVPNYTTIAFGYGNPVSLAGLTPGDYYIIVDAQEDDRLGGYGIGPLKCVGPPDADQDGTFDPDDDCAAVFNPSQSDRDEDGVGDECDVCPNHADPAQDDGDADGFGDACDPCANDPLNDEDGDGYCADRDNCPQDFNSEQLDEDRDGIGDRCDAVSEVFGGDFESGNVCDWSTAIPTNGCP